MTAPIDPVILRKLDDFGRRRRRLILVRGAIAAAATLLLTMMLVAVVDAIFVLPDTARWSLSGAAYLAALAVEWRSTLRLLLKKPGRRELARMVESTEPGLRESLLSAVELSEADHEALGTSPRFRELLESSVSQKLRGTDVESLLPARLVRRTIALGAGALLLCVVAFFLSGRQFGTLLLRALAPGANLARVSQVQVRIVEPTQPDKVVAQGETEPLLIEIAGKRVNAARLETVTAGGRAVLKMNPVGQDRFSAAIQVGREDVTYRVFAGDAVTRKFHLRAVARPHVVSFEKTFVFPPYVGREPRHVTEENGDLVALEGSKVQLRLTTNLPVSAGELRLEQGGKTSAIPLELHDGALTGEIALDASGTYRVHLVATETGFENKFSPEYELRAEPDLVPQIELESPQKDLLLPANEIVTLQGSANDDQGLARIEQKVKVNEGEWRTIVLLEKPGREAAFERRWDLYEQGAKPGDLLSTKLVAVDLKGGTAESRVLRISVTNSGFEAKRLAALAAQRKLYETLQALRTAGEQFARSARDARGEFDRIPEADEQRRQVTLTAGSALADFDRAATAAREQLFLTLRESEPGHTAADLVQLGHALSRADTGKAALDTLTADPLRPQGRELMREFAEAAEKAAQRTRRIEDSQRDLLGAAEIEVITENVLVVASETRRLAQLADAVSEPAQWASIAGRLRVVLAESRNLEEIATASTGRQTAERLKWLRKEFADTRGRIETVLAKGEPGPELREPIQMLGRLADAAVGNTLGQHNEFTFRATKEHLDLRRDTQPAWTQFDKLREDLARAASRKDWPDDLRRTLADARWENRGQLFKQLGDLEEARPSADTAFLHDARAATLALDALRMKSADATPDETRTRLAALDKNFRLLEAAHGLAELLDILQHLGAAERWEISSAHERTNGPREWRWLETRLRFAPEEFDRIQADAPLRQTLQTAQNLLRHLLALPAWNELTREMNERFNPQREPVTAAAHVASIAAELKAVLDLLREPIDEARHQLTEMAPKLHEIMDHLAKQSDELKRKTEEQAQQVAEKNPEQTQAEAQQALEAQQKLTERVEALKDALRADANRQDILQDEGRERARDADDALALLKDPPPNAEAALSEAAQATTAQQKTEALQTAAQEQKKLANALEQLAQHYEATEQGKAAETRQALRKTEEQTGIKDAMERQFSRAEELQKMAEKSPEELLKELEQALPKNPLMQQELSNISRNTLEDAAKKLNAASATENEVAQNIDKLAKETPPAPAPPTAGSEQPSAAQPAPAPGEPQAPPANPQAAPPMPRHPALNEAADRQKPIADTAGEAGEDVARAGRHEQRLDNTAPGKKLEALGNEVKETAATQIPKTAETLTQAQQAAQAAPAVNAANELLRKQLGNLQQALRTPPSSPSPMTPPHSPTTSQSPASTPANAASDAVPPMPQLPSAFGQKPAAPPTPVEQMWMARTLDSLDAALHTDPNAATDNPGAQQQPGQQPAQNGEQQNAQQGQQPPQGQRQQPGQQPGQQQMTSAQQAMNNAAKAAAAAMRASRTPKPAENQGDPTNDDGPEQQVSRSGAQAQAAGKAYGKLQNARGKSGEWGKLPKQVAEQLTRGQNENVAGEYRSQVETYYRVIAEKSKKP